MKFHKVLKAILPMIIALSLELTYTPNERKLQCESENKFILLAFAIACGNISFRQILRFLVESKIKRLFRGEKIPKSQNTFAALSATLDPMELRKFIYHYFLKVLRQKGFTPFALTNGQYVIAIDGVETHHSKEKHCEDCLKRVHKKGTPEEWIEYYHREVVVTLVGPAGAFFIDSEPISPKYNDTGKDSEVEAAKRLIARLAENKMLRCFSILVVDALFAKAPFILLVKSYGLIPIVRIKQENFCVMQDIKGLGELVPFSEKRLDEERNLEYQIREFNNLTSWDSYPGELRIVEIKGKYLKKKKNNNYHAYWVIPQEISSSLSMELIRTVGHLRWKEELNTFRSLKQNFKIQHLTHHHPVSIQVIFLLKCFLHSVLNLYLIRKLNPFTKRHYFIKDIIEFIKINILSVKREVIKESFDTS